jgi:tetratricopeptide (TPR) repeat protein
MRTKPVRSGLASGLIAFLASPCLLLGQSAPPDQIQQHMQKAEQALHVNDLAAAEHEYREILTIDAKNTQAWTGLGVLLYGAGKAEKAMQSLQMALSIDPAARNAELFLGLSEAELRQCAQATPILSKYFAAESVGKLQRLTGLALLECTADAADPIPALQTVQRLKQLYPGDADVLYESAELYTRLWNENAGELIANHPDSYRVHQLAGEVYEAKSNYDQAIREYNLALERNPKLPQMHFRIGQIYLHQGNEEVDEKAMNEFRLEKEIDPDSAVTDLAMADIEMHRHNLDQAKPLYEEAARLDPSLVDASVGLARILLEQHDTDAAVQRLQSVVAQHPDDAQAHYVLMLAYRGQKKMPEAAAQMEIFNRLQTQKAETFQSKMNALLNGKPASTEAQPK